MNKIIILNLEVEMERVYDYLLSDTYEKKNKFEKVRMNELQTNINVNILGSKTRH